MTEKIATITMVGIPLVPLIVSIGITYLNIFKMSTKCNNSTCDSFMDTLYVLIVSVASFFTIYGMEVYFK